MELSIGWRSVGARRTLLIAAFLPIGASTAVDLPAQTVPHGPQGIAELVEWLSGSCFRGHRLPRCKAFWIGEFGYGYRPGAEAGAVATQLTWDFGAMVNLDRRSAVGGTAHFGNQVENWFDSVNFGLKARYRFWLADGLSIEASPGMLLWDFDGGAWRSGFTGHVAVNLYDVLAVSASLDAVDGYSSWAVGGRTGSYATLLPTGLFVLVLSIGCAFGGGCF